MSSRNLERGPSKKVRVKIFEDFVSHRFFLQVIKSLLEHDRKFGKDFIVHAPVGDAMLAKITRDGQELIIASGGEDDPHIHIKGDYDLVREFVEFLAVEASTLIALEFCMALEKMCTTFSPDKLREVLRVKIKEGLDEVLI